MYYKIELQTNDLKQSIQWSLQRGNRTGRTAWQFILHLAAEAKLYPNFDMTDPAITIDPVLFKNFLLDILFNIFSS